MRLDGDELETRYRHVLESLGKQKGVLRDRAILEEPRSLTTLCGRLFAVLDNAKLQIVRLSKRLAKFS